ncbi:hypothetical protein SC1083_0041 [Aggregatibacter actinomycetemcomitans serotype e str. SC1083]|uniref:Uncharacterized protein n=1 Tax=Aggregatibacter actinomycetemcomitans serotype e str. SC1083 TaxID=907488 RepID=G4A5F6_AGGAC|nr:hypothetical protein SC1083_0041 [Aggregatibacter actinomycetemcomitans serotype e str. SC1083]
MWLNLCELILTILIMLILLQVQMYKNQGVLTLYKKIALMNFSMNFTKIIG